MLISDSRSDTHPGSRYLTMVFLYAYIGFSGSPAYFLNLRSCGPGSIFPRTRTRVLQKLRWMVNLYELILKWIQIFFFQIWIHINYCMNFNLKFLTRFTGPAAPAEDAPLVFPEDSNLTGFSPRIHRILSSGKTRSNQGKFQSLGPYNITIGRGRWFMDVFVTNTNLNSSVLVQWSLVKQHLFNQLRATFSPWLRAYRGQMGEGLEVGPSRPIAIFIV